MLLKEYSRYHRAVGEAVRLRDLKALKHELELSFSTVGKTFPELASPQDESKAISGFKVLHETLPKPAGLASLGVENKDGFTYLKFFQTTRAPSNAFKPDSPQVDWLTAGWIKFKIASSKPPSVVTARSKTELLNNPSSPQTQAKLLLEQLPTDKK